jgi:hypothetical protein
MSAQQRAPQVSPQSVSTGTGVGQIREMEKACQLGPIRFMREEAGCLGIIFCVETNE